jgi:GNAT superfamily N-acetyltransferase
VNIEIKQAYIENTELIAELFDLYRVFYKQPSNKDLAKQFITDRLVKKDSIIFFAEDDNGEYLGFTQLYPSFSSVSVKRLWILNDLYVKESVRRLGVAKMLMQAAKDHAKSTNAKGLSLKTAIDNYGAQALYESMDYQQDKAFYTYDLIL